MTENKESDESVNKVEQITKEPTTNISQNSVATRIKDPRKIEAGKKLAAYNKKAKKSKADLKEKDGVASESVTVGGRGPLFDISLTTVVAIMGLGLTAVDLYLGYEKIIKKGWKIINRSPWIINRWPVKK